MTADRNPAGPDTQFTEQNDATLGRFEFEEFGPGGTRRMIHITQPKWQRWNFMLSTIRGGGPAPIVERPADHQEAQAVATEARLNDEALLIAHFIAQHYGPSGEHRAILLGKSRAQQLAIIAAEQAPPETVATIAVAPPVEPVPTIAATVAPVEPVPTIAPPPTVIGDSISEPALSDYDWPQNIP